MKRITYRTPTINELEVGLECELHEYSNILPKPFTDDWFDIKMHALTAKELIYLLKGYISSENKKEYLEHSIRIVNLTIHDTN